VCEGFFSTLDKHSPGNYGLYDLLKVLEWIQKNIIHFRGDPSRVTLVGSDSGAAMISLLLLSPKSYINGALSH
jgi:carboxylesterase type B